MKQTWVSNGYLSNNFYWYNSVLELREKLRELQKHLPCEIIGADEVYIVGSGRGQLVLRALKLLHVLQAEKPQNIVKVLEYLV